MKTIRSGILAASLMVLALVMAIAPSRAATLLNVTVTTAVTAQTTTPQEMFAQDSVPLHALIEAVFTYGSGGTNATAYVQTSLDNGTTWIDVVTFQFTTSSSKKIYNLSALTPVTTAVTPTDGSLSANTAVDGIVGPIWRVKYTTTGTYAGSTNFQVNFAGARLRSQ